VGSFPEPKLIPSLLKLPVVLALLVTSYTVLTVLFISYLFLPFYFHKRMAFEDFCRHFTKATMCHLMNTSRFSFSKRWHLFKHNNEWKPGISAGGCVTNQDTFLQNPQVQEATTLNHSNKYFQGISMRFHKGIPHFSAQKR